MNILKRKTKEHLGSWVDILLEVMWTYMTTIKTPTNHTPFILAYGFEVVAPIELIWPTARIVGYNDDHKG